MTALLEPPIEAVAPAKSAHSAVEKRLIARDFAAPIAEACARIPPLWPLKNFVAVNPFVGLATKTFVEACDLMPRVAHGQMLMPLCYYRAQYENGRIGDGDLQSAVEQTRRTLGVGNVDVPTLKAATSSTRSEAKTTAILTVTDALDAQFKTQWTPFVVDEISKWCSAFYDEGQASWRMPWRGDSLFAAWREAALRDANPEMMGLRGFRTFVQSLPHDADATIVYALNVLQIAPENATDFLHRQLLSVAGWSGHIRYHTRERELRGKSDDSLQQLLAMRLAYEVALFQQLDLGEIWQKKLAALRDQNAGISHSTLTNYLWQLAAENAWQRELLAKISTVQKTEKAETRPSVQAIFCIDVRSEVLRRALEATSPAIETVGFAGFFGFPIEYVPFGARHGAAQCPVLLTPKFRVRESLIGASRAQTENALHEQLFSRRVARSWNSFKTSAVSCFSFVETGGLLAGAKIVKDSLGIHRAEKPSGTAPCLHHENAPHEHKGHDHKGHDHKGHDHKGHEHAHLHESGLSLSDQIAVAANALKHIGLTQLARLVVVCGHGSQTANNPYASGLDCGACGGHSGEANARVAAAVLNDPQVREGLSQQGFSVPDDTIFVAALHNTTTDDVTLYIEYSIPETHREEVQRLEKWFAAASHQTRLQRAASLGLGAAEASEIDDLVRARSSDWAQTRPEWGLAGNAAFIAAPRHRTQSLNLQGRVFLNNYDHQNDADLSKLELVLTAPMIVASWINLQYFASTVNNERFGSGNKTTHNVVGTVGVWQGNSGDLKVGLPLQSVHDGEKWMHEPLRLTVLIEAPRAAIEAVLARHASVRQLLDNGWLHLFAVENDGQDFARYVGAGVWHNEP